MPDTSHGHLAETFPAVPESVSKARDAVSTLAAQAGADNDALDAIRLATSEAVTNVVLHAYGGQAGPIHLMATVAAGSVRVAVADEGDGLRPRLDRKGIGIGLAVIAEAADEVAIASGPSGGTELQMSFGLATSRAANAA